MGSGRVFSHPSRGILSLRPVLTSSPIFSLDYGRFSKRHRLRHFRQVKARDFALLSPKGQRTRSPSRSGAGGASDVAGGATWTITAKLADGVSGSWRTHLSQVDPNGPDSSKSPPTASTLPSRPQRTQLFHVGPQRPRLSHVGPNGHDSPKSAPAATTLPSQPPTAPTFLSRPQRP